jgi:hypothetical protein
MSAFRSLSKSVLPSPVVRLVRRWLSRRRCSEVLDSWAHFDSVLSGVAADAAGEATPWFTYGAIAFLSQFDYSNKTVFEWGSGASSLYWARRALQVVSVEHDAEWIARVRPRLSANVRLLHETDPGSYCRAIEQAGRQFDVISVDGRFRRDCVRIAVRCLAPGGLIVFDNSEEFIATCQKVRSNGLIQIDFSGFGPVRDSPWTTSIFLRGELALRPIGDRQPQPLPGSASIQLDEDPALGSSGLAGG